MFSPLRRLRAALLPPYAIDADAMPRCCHAVAAIDAAAAAAMPCCYAAYATANIRRVYIFFRFIDTLAFVAAMPCRLRCHAFACPHAVLSCLRRY